MAEHQSWQQPPVDEPDSGPQDLDLELAEVVQPVPVDDPSLPVKTVEGKVLDAAPGFRDQPQIHVLPSWARTPKDAATAAAWAVGHYTRLVAMHGIRLPIYWVQLLSRAPVGMARMAWGWWRWANDSGTRDYMASLGHQEASQFNSLDGRRREAQKVRFGASAIFAAAAAFGSWWLLGRVQPGALWAFLLLVVVPLLGWRGRPVGRPLIRTNMADTELPPVNSSLILTALGSLGIPSIRDALKEGADHPIRFAMDAHRDGPGVRADIDLPPGVTASDVIERRDALASGLRRPISCVWPEGDTDAHAGRLVLWVGDKPMAKQKPVVWPLAAKGAVNLFEPFQIGVDPRGRPITITLMFATMLIGAMSRMGKSVLARLLMLACALDPRAELHIYDLKGSRDMLPLAGVAYRLVAGDDEEDIVALLTDAREIQQGMRRRYKRIKNLPADLCPESKVTDQLASRRELKLHPVVLFIDECQIGFDHPTYGKELAAICIDISKRGPAVGIIPIFCTQKMDKGSIPTALTSNAILRFCLRVANQVANDMILGTSAYKSGIRATMFTRKEVGVGYLAGEADDPTITRVAYVDDLAALKIAARARQMRIASGLLSGQAAGEEMPELEAPPSMLAHLADFWPDPLKRETYKNLATRLAEELPDTYPQCTEDMVAAACRAAQLSVVQVKRDQKWLGYGVERAALIEHLDTRPDEEESTP